MFLIFWKQVLFYPIFIWLFIEILMIDNFVFWAFNMNVVFLVMFNFVIFLKEKQLQFHRRDMFGKRTNFLYFVFPWNHSRQYFLLFKIIILLEVYLLRWSYFWWWSWADWVFRRNVSISYILIGFFIVFWRKVRLNAGWLRLKRVRFEQDFIHFVLNIRPRIAIWEIMMLKGIIE